MFASMRMILLLLLWSPVMALGLEHPFTALAVKQLPGKAESQAMIYVTADRVRMEYPSGSGHRVEITHLKTGDAFVLLPEQRIYTRHTAAPAVLEQMQQAGGAETPCVRPSKAKCTKLGEESLFGRQANKWEMVVEHEGQQYRSLYWIDTERQMPLRQVWADGTVSELRPVGETTREGRNTEKWQLSMRLPDGRTHSAEQWFDSQLKIMTAEIIPGGYKRELRNIEVGPIDPALFEIPQGYRQVRADNVQPGGESQRRQ